LPIWTYFGTRAIARPKFCAKVPVMDGGTGAAKMSAMTIVERGHDLGARLTAALADPARRDRNVVVVLLCYVALWTLYAVIAKGSQDVHYDMAEQLALSRELAFGHAKHPPLAPAIVGAWFTVFPVADWAYYLLAVSTAALALWICWRLSERFLDGEKRVAGLALLTLVPFFNFHALKFNQNTVLLPLWAATTLFFLRSFESRRMLDAVLAGVFAALAIYGKYWSVMLLLGLGISALTDRRRDAYFRSSAPWVTIAAGALVLAPHIAWLIGSNFAPFSYALATHAAPSFAAVALSVLTYSAGAVAYVAIPVLLALVAMRPDRAAAADMLWPEAPERRLAAVAFWAPLLVPVAVALLAQFQLTSLWTMSAWSLLPVVLLSSPRVNIGLRDVANLVALAVIVPLVMIAAAPAVAYMVHRNGVTPGAAHAAQIAQRVDAVWRETSDRPLRLFAGWEDFGYGVAFYLPERPHVVNALDGVPPADLDARIARQGIAMVCPADARGCVDVAMRRASRASVGRRVEAEVSRRYFNIEGDPARYVIVAVAPRL
jgi:hypothetical protein